MGMDACVLAVGPFGDKVRDMLDYPEDYYEDVKDGAIVTKHLFTCNTTDQSKQLAAALGIDAWNFNTHNISGAMAMAAVDFKALYELEEYCAE